MKKPKAVLIGAGSIGGTKPDHIDNPQTGILSHAHAINVYCEPLAVIDRDQDKAEAVAKKWGFRNTDQDMGVYQAADLFVIATPTETHLEVFGKLLPWLAGKKVLLEKPAGESHLAARAIYELAKEKHVQIAINYQRCSLPAYDAEFLEQQIGPRNRWRITLHYCRGYVRDASHFFALLQLWDISPGALYLQGGIDDYSSEDLTYSAVGNQVHMVAHDGRIADVFQIEIVGDRGRAVFEDHGKRLEIYYHQRETTFGDYQTWASAPEVSVTTGLENGLSAVYRDLLSGVPRVTIADAVEIWKLIENRRLVV